MAADKFNGIDDLPKRRRWSDARKLLEREREKDPKNHWVPTQLGART